MASRNSAPLALLCAVVSLTACPRSGSVPDHLVLVSIDTLRRDRLGVYGNDRGLTPNMDRWARRGAVCRDALAQAVSTPPSHASILSGLDPPTHGLRRLWGQALDPSVRTLAEILGDAGFETAAFVSAAPLRRAAGLDQGFDHYDDRWDRRRTERSAGETNRRVQQWLETVSPERLFLWVHYFDPHAPYWPPAAFREQWAASTPRPPFRRAINANPRTGSPRRLDDAKVESMRELYDAEVGYTDWALGELLGSLERRGIMDDALLVIVSDHGECLGEHGYYFGHWDVFDPTARIPLIFVHPDGRWSGRSIDVPVATSDIVPTVLAALGIEPPSQLDGIDLSPLMRGKAPAARWIFTEQREYFPVSALRNDAWLYLRYEPRDAEAPMQELLIDRASGQEVALEESRRRSLGLEAAWKRFHERTGTAREVEIDEATAKQLEALGYLDPESGASR